MLLSLNHISIQRYFPVISKANPFTYNYISFHTINYIIWLYNWSRLINWHQYFYCFPKLNFPSKSDDFIHSGYSRGCTLWREFSKDELQECFEGKKDNRIKSGLSGDHRAIDGLARKLLGLCSKGHCPLYHGSPRCVKRKGLEPELGQSLARAPTLLCILKSPVVTWHVTFSNLPHSWGIIERFRIWIVDSPPLSINKQ